LFEVVLAVECARLRKTQGENSVTDDDDDAKCLQMMALNVLYDTNFF
jgi:hypothetical protein